MPNRHRFKKHVAAGSSGADRADFFFSCGLTNSPCNCAPFVPLRVICPSCREKERERTRRGLPVVPVFAALRRSDSFCVRRFVLLTVYRRARRLTITYKLFVSPSEYPGVSGREGYRRWRFLDVARSHRTRKYHCRHALARALSSRKYARTRVEDDLH